MSARPENLPEQTDCGRLSGGPFCLLHCRAMRTRINVLICVVGVLLVSGYGSAQQKPAAKYPELAQKLRAGDMSVNFWELRASCFDWSDCGDYDPHDAKQKMFRALQANDFAEALKSANEILKHKITDLDAQAVAWMADKEMGNEQEAGVHLAITKKLMDSIMQGNDGKSPQHAWMVVEVPEEYSVLRLLGLRTTKQALLQNNGHAFDEMTVSDGKHEITLYFNIDFDMKKLGETIGGATKK